jgi:hypothetical protein
MVLPLGVCVQYGRFCLEIALGILLHGDGDALAET